MWDKSIFLYIIISNIYLVTCRPSNIEPKAQPEKVPMDSILLSKLPPNNALTEDVSQKGTNTITAKKRVKRQGSGKFSEAANMTEMKTLRLFLQMFRNMWAASYVGGTHPLHPDVPKPVLLLFKQQIMDTFFPPDKKKETYKK